MRQARPLAYFVGVARGVYQAVFPVYLIDEEPHQRQFVVALDDYQAATVPPTRGAMTEPGRRYAERLLKLRLHQPVFRARVLRAYESQCAMCHLRHASLLDAAHILPDTHPDGDPVLPNGLALCKIHHAAYDGDILGVRPDLVIECRPEILREIDGPMLRHGLQELHGRQITVPRVAAARPDPQRLDERYHAFLQAA
jgi:putative restriction endonuclease